MTQNQHLNICPQTHIQDDVVQINSTHNNKVCVIFSITQFVNFNLESVVDRGLWLLPIHPERFQHNLKEHKFFNSCRKF